MATVVGYHGCHKDFANGVRTGMISLDEWKPSQNAYDWLGEGIYFWETSRTRAESWAAQRFGDAGDILEVDIELGTCLNLLEETYHHAIAIIFRNLRAAYRDQGWTLPTNRRKRHDLDCLVLNKFVTLKEGLPRDEAIVFQTIRGIFEEGRPLFPGSAIRRESHIQIAVRDPRCIRNPR